MKMIEFNTRLFKNIFPTYQSFADWYRASPLSEDENDVPSLKTFTLIANEYNDNHCSMSVESFKQRFANDIYTYYREFEETSKSILELMKLTDDEISTADSMITNYANIPEEPNSTNVEEVDYITSQQKSINKKGKLQIKKEQLSTKRAFTTKTFINRFRHLFIKVITPYYTNVYGEPIGD